MSSYINCCSLPYKKNSTDIKTWLTALPAPDHDCGVALPAHSIPLSRQDSGAAACFVTPSSCGSNGMGIGPWPYPYPSQTFESLTVLTGVTFAYSGTTITATKSSHGLIVGGETFTISGQIGTNAVLNGSWTVASIVDVNTFTFEISSSPTTALTAATLDFRRNMDFCKGRGFKTVQSKKSWNGRWGFVDDYVTTPKLAQSKYQSADYTASFLENYSGTQQSFDGGGNPLCVSSGSGSQNISTHCVNSLSVGGVGICTPQMNYSDGLANWLECPSTYWDYWKPCSIFSCGGDFQVPLVMQVTGYPELISSGYNTSVVDSNKQLLKDLTYIDSDRSIVTLKIPWFKTIDGYQTYQGPISGIATWLAGFNLDISGIGCNAGQCDDYKVYRNFTITDLKLTNTEFSFTIKCDAFNQYHIYTDDGTGHLGTPIYFADYKYSGTYSAKAVLSSEYKFSKVQSDAFELLNQWDMTDDTVYPWRTDSNCGVAPMVVRKEMIGTSPSIGYCEAETNSNDLLRYDNSIYGAPLTEKAYYDKGWFDFYSDKYMYSPDPFGGTQLCYEYGQYAPSYLPTMATHWTDGATDTSDRGGSWQPFSRFKYNYLYDLPPFVNNSCAFISNNQEAFWASKWAEIKEPLPSQNYWGVCGVQPNQCATDSHNGGFGVTCSPMRDLKVLDATTCEITGTDRYPTAFAICGKAAIVSMSRDSGSGVVTVVHASTPLLRTGDAVDFINAGDTITVSNVTVTVDSDTQFHFTGSLPTGSFIVSHGATGFSFYDLAPKGYFVRTTNNRGAITAEEGNVQSTGAKVGIIAILPLGSPELASPKWPARSTVQYTDYPSILPTESWLSSINQAMSDRFWIKSQDEKISDGGDPATCVAKNQDGTPCDPLGDPCVPLITPLVEARLHAPTGAPLQFTSDNLTPTPQWYKMPSQTDWSFSCSNVWNYGESLTAFKTQHGVANNYADAIGTTGISTDTDAGWGTADGYFIP